MHKYVVYPINNADIDKNKESFVNISKYFQLEYEFIVGIIVISKSNFISLITLAYRFLFLVYSIPCSFANMHADYA